MNKLVKAIDELSIAINRLADASAIRQPQVDAGFGSDGRQNDLGSDRNSFTMNTVNKIRGGGQKEDSCIYANNISNAAGPKESRQLLRKISLGFYFVVAFFRMFRPIIALTVYDICLFIVVFNCLHTRQIQKEKRKVAAALDKRRRELPNWMHCRLSNQMLMDKPVVIKTPSPPSEPVDEIDFVFLKLLGLAATILLLSIYLRILLEYTSTMPLW